MRLSTAALLCTLLLSCASSPRGSLSDKSTFPDRYGAPSDSVSAKDGTEDSALIDADDSSLPEAVFDPGAPEEDDSGKSSILPSPEKTVPDKPDDSIKDRAFLDSIKVAPLSKIPKEYRLYTNNRFNYQLFAPQNWYINESTVSDTAVTRISRNSSVMSIKTYKPYRLKKDYYKLKAVREIKLKDAKYKTIIAGEELRLYSGVFAILMVHEYKYRNVLYLSRTLTFIQEGNAYIIRCEAPISRFYKDEKHFNTLMTSFRYLRE